MYFAYIQVMFWAYYTYICYAECFRKWNYLIHLEAAVCLSLHVNICRFMQKILKYVYLKSQTPTDMQARRFVYFQFIGKPINGTKKIDMLMLCVVGASVCVLSFTSLLFGKILNSSAVICLIDLMQAKFSLLQKEALPELRRSSCTILHNELDSFST